MKSEASPLDAKSRRISLVPVLAYHFFGFPETNSGFDRHQLPYVVSADVLRRHLEGLKAAGYSEVDVTHYLSGVDAPQPAAMLTIDDAHISSLTVALPILYEHDYRGIIFVPTAFVGERGFLSRKQIAQIAENGTQIGSHGHSHRALTALSHRQMEDELRKSRRTLEDIIGAPVTLLALPHGFGSRAVISVAREIGYEAVFTSRFGLNDSRQPSCCLNRIGIKNSPAWPQVQELLDPWSFAHLQAMAVDRTKGFAKWLLRTRQKRCK